MTSANTAGGAVPFEEGRAMLGSYLSLEGKTYAEALAFRREQLGRDQAIEHVFYPWTGWMPGSLPDIGADSVLMISWKGGDLGPINDGSQDEMIATAAKTMAGMNRPILLRWAWEMNGYWFAWDGTHNDKKPALFIKAWRRMRKIFTENGADATVAWCWAPNWADNPDASWNAMDHYYPGDDYVDWVGVSGYNFSGESPTTLFTHIVKSYGARKPIVLAETAAVSAKATWIKKLSAYVTKTSSIGAVVWFDTDNQPGTKYNFRFDTDTAALAAYRSMASSTRFSGSLP
ncbi:glycosyl hydrolase [Actinoplanes sp. NPDC051851]|uniref:glycoside hydrolase family 26 protein n=1 Tax=Actinoplanes sp. NPDC051851 TaxID=3154753 RepID=UPI003421B23C